MSFIERLVTPESFAFLQEHRELLSKTQSQIKEGRKQELRLRIERIQKAATGLQNLSSLAIHDLCNLRLNPFDDLACDSACQIRAIETAVFAKKLSEKSLEERINQLEKEFGLLCVKPNPDDYFFAKILLKVVHPQTPLEKKFSTLCDRPILSPNRDSLQIIALAHMLHQVKDEVPSEVPCPGCKRSGTNLRDRTVVKKLSNPLGTLVNDIISRAQSSIATMGCQQLVKLVNEYHLPIQKELTEEMLESVPNSGKDRLELPCFLSIEAALELAASAHIPVLIRSKKTDHSFEASSKEPFDVQILCTSKINGEKEASLVPFEGIPENQPILVIDGFRARCKVKDEPSETYKERLGREDLAHLIRINAAAHFQFTTGKSGKEEERKHISEKGFPDFAKRLRILDLVAQEKGCTVENPSLFVILHVYASTIAEQKLTTGGVS